MKESELLDMGGHSEPGNSPSHLGSGSIVPPTRKFKRPKPTQVSEDVQAKVLQSRATLKQDVKDILIRGAPTRSYIKVYQDVEKLCLHKSSEQSSLAMMIYDEIHTHLESAVVPKLRECLNSFTSETAKETAQEFMQLFDKFDESLKLLQQLFLYLDRSYLSPHHKKLCIRPFGIQTLASSLFSDKDGNSNDPNDLGVQLLSNLLRDTRSSDFEPSMVDLSRATLERFKELGSDLGSAAIHQLESVIVKDYHDLSIKWMEEQKEFYIILLLSKISKEVALLRSVDFSPDISESIQSRIIWNNMLVDLQAYLMPSLPNLCTPMYSEYLETVRALCDDSLKNYGADSKKMFLFIWGQHVQSLTESAIASENIVSRLLELWHSFETLFQRSLQDNSYNFEARSSISKVLGSHGVSVKLLVQLSKFCDVYLKSPHKANQSFEQFQTDVLTIFKLIPNKSEFMKIYARDLSKRMLTGKAFDFDVENDFVESLIAVVGDTDDRTKVRAMFRDYKQSREVYEHIHYNENPQLEFSAFVLEKKHWPTIPGIEVDAKLPGPLQTTLDNFLSSYVSESSKRKHHKLDWSNYALHQVTLTVHFDKGPKDLALNLLQATVLMLFENKEEMSYEEMREMSRIEEKLLKRIVGSLSTSKTPILIATPTYIKFNGSFTDKSKIVRVPMLKERVGSTKNEVENIVSRERSSEIRAALVRIMKSEKTLPFAGLMGKSIELLEEVGKIAVSDLKSEIENLILNEYIRRDEDGTTLHYIP